MIRYAVASGSATNTATWNGGTLPVAGDYIYANGFTVQFSVDVNYGNGTISTEICPITGIPGGLFTYSNIRVLTMNIVAGTTMCLQYININSILTLIGNVRGGTSANAYGINYYTAISVIGNVTGGSATGAHGIFRALNTQGINVTGNITGGSGAYGVYPGAATNSTFSGIITANTFPGIFISLTSDVIGSAIGSLNAAAIEQQGTNYSINFTGTATNVGGRMAICVSSIFFSPSSSTTWIFQDENLVDKPLYTADVLENPPAINNVRTGIVYGIGNNYTGTCAVPAATEVVKGVAIDNTIGTYALSGDLITRLEQCSTVPITGAQIASYNV